MDPIDAAALTRALVDIDSTTGKEAEAGRFIADLLRSRGYTVTEQQVADGRFNVVASLDAPPHVVLSTHYDCVPPFFPSREENGRIYGRGACDAKGILAAQVAAAESLRAQGERRLALLYVVGEERGSDGARVANETPLEGVRYFVNGEPTEGRLGRASRGAYRVRLDASGRAAHSAYPELGESAIDKLLQALEIVRGMDWPSDPDVGETFYTIGLINGGIAPNVIAPAASAELLFRTVGDNKDIRAMLDGVEPLVTVRELLSLPAVRMHVPPGFEAAVFSYTTDISCLTNWGTPLLFGPGSIHVAHTASEFIDIAELQAAVSTYARLATSLLAD